MIRRPPRSTHCISSAASDVYKRQEIHRGIASANAKKLSLKLVSANSNKVKCNSPKKSTENKATSSTNKEVRETSTRGGVKIISIANKTSVRKVSNVVRMQTRNVLAKTAAQIDTSVKRLYEEEVDKRQKRRMVYEEIKKEKELEELNFQFKPNINDLSKKIVETSGDRLENRLAKRSKKLMERMEALRKEREMKETLNCTFRPRINQKSIALASNRSESLDINSPTTAKHLKNTLEETGRKKLTNTSTDECTFHPNIRSSMQTLKRSLSIVKPSTHSKIPIQSPNAIPGRSKNCYTIGEHLYLSLIHICRCRRYAVCRSRWSPYH
eukprot:TRINITY_DN2626_c0_g5_i2.p1 TRINITY_DN2626_c0_g5~~TRINITY_DN2626_c0_g5_i2.p1  ORF type:complete len:334 (-),score=98.46 TRINITY_DN2626_c0_g5_i2:22-999(-)